MPSYRVYIQGPDGDIVGADAFECGGDDEAVEIAREKADGRPVELWRRERRLIAFSDAPTVQGRSAP
jgi:hypothetical protein